VSHTRDAERGEWRTSIEIPWDVLPTPITRGNVFAILDGEFLALNPVPGSEPDFHQPQSYPEMRIA